DAGEARRLGVAASEPRSSGADLGGDGGGSGWIMPALILLLVVAPAGVVALVLGRRVQRLRTLPPELVADLQLSELRRALLRLGWDLPASTTLLGLERRLGRFAGPASEAYAGALRAHRYDPRRPSAPSLRSRRAVRRELTRGSVFDRLRGLIAIPPGAQRSEEDLFKA